MNSIKDMVSGGKVVRFIYFRQSELWYATECGFDSQSPSLIQELLLSYQRTKP